jgi:uncharacterized protein (TIGR03067 family)
MLPALLVLALSAPADPPKEKAKEKELSAETKKELKKLEGKWQMVKAATNQGEGDVKELEAFCVVSGSELTFSRGDKKETIRVTAIDTTTDPKCIDLTEVRADKTERILEGIFKIDGDTFQLAFAVPKDGKIRPTSFDKPTDARTMVWTFKRVKE